MKKKIDDFILVADKFGPMPIWSLQHPNGEKCRHITDLKIELIDIRGFYPTDEDMKP